MKGLKKGVLIGVAFLAGSAAVFAGGGNDQGTGAATGTAGSSASTVIRWAFWGSSHRIEITQEAIALYESQNPGVRINFEPYSGNSAELEIVRTQIAGGNAPDIIQMGGNWPDLAAQAEPLEGYAELNRANIDQAALDVVSQNGHLYGVSVGNVYNVLVYNKSLLDRAGVAAPKANMTWDELYTYLTSIKAKLPSGTYPIMDLGFLSQGETPYGHWLRTRGIVAYDAATKSTGITQAIIKEWLDLWAKYRAEGLIPPADVASQYAEANADSSALIAGKVAFTYIASSMFAGYQAATKDTLDIAALPGANAQNKAYWLQLSQVMMVNKDSKHKTEAVKFINWIVTSPEAGKILGSDRGISASPTYRAGVAGDPVTEKINALVAALGDAAFSPETDHTPNDSEMVSQEFLIYQRVQFGQIDTTTGAQQLYDERIRLINK